LASNLSSDTVQVLLALFRNAASTFAIVNSFQNTHTFKLLKHNADHLSRSTLEVNYEESAEKNA
jgi:hypothetical protein